MLMVVLNTASTHHSPDKDWLRFKEKETCDRKKRIRECVEACALAESLQVRSLEDLHLSLERLMHYLAWQMYE